MELNEFLEYIKNEELDREKMKTMTIPSSTHKKIKQTALLYDIPQSKLIKGILNQWIEKHQETIIKDKVKAIRMDFFCDNEE